MKLIKGTKHTVACINNLYCDPWWPGMFVILGKDSKVRVKTLYKYAKSCSCETREQDILEVLACTL